MSQDPRPVLLTSGWLLAAARGRKGERGCVRKLSAVLCDNGAVHGRHIWPQWIAGQPFGWPARASRRVGRSSHPEGRSASGGPARRVDGRGRPCVVNAIRAKRGPLVQRHPSPLGVSSTHSPSQCCGGHVTCPGRSTEAVGRGPKRTRRCSLQNGGESICASTRASTASVLARCPIACAKRRACNGLARASGRPACRSASSKARCQGPVGSYTTERTGWSTHAISALNPAGSLVNRAALPAGAM